MYVTPCVTWIIHVWHDSFICVTWLIDMCGMTVLYVWHDESFICVTWLISLVIRMRDMTHLYVWHDSFIYATRLIHMFCMTRSYVWHDSFICVTWLIHTCDMTHPYVWHDPFICATWLIHTCDMPHSYVWHASFICVTCSFICVTRLIHMRWHDSFICATRLIHMYAITHSYAVTWLICVLDQIFFSHVCMSHGTCIQMSQGTCMGWLRSVGSIKLQVSFAEYRLFYRALLQKRPIILSILLTKATPYDQVITHVWMSHVTHMNESFPHDSVRDSYAFAQSMCDMTHSHVWHDSFTCVT